jgi:phage-related minor tail protein
MNETSSTGNAGKSLADFVGGPLADAGKSIDTVMNRAFGAMEKTIARACASGKLSVKDMVSAIVADVERIAARQYIEKPVESILSSLADAILPVSGARAAGGPVAAGEAYLVGERGPELFVPSTGGAIAATAGTQTRASVTLNVKTSDAQSFLKSGAQVSAMMLRALARGKRNL